DVEALFQPTGFFRTMARAITSMSSQLLERHRGDVPASMEALVELSGVGRKTANVVLGHALGVPGLPVDRHVMRVATRIGLASGRTPERIEQELGTQVDPARWTLLSDCLILHGRRVCRPRPACPKCAISDACLFYRTAQAGIGTQAGVGASARPRARASRASRSATRKPGKPSGSRPR
ncbi:MAG: endonuclease III, partial [Vicinamibacterales bacterium]